MKNSEWRLLGKISDSIVINENNKISIIFDDFINQNIRNIFTLSSNIEHEHILCVGQIQSGKTKNIENLILYGIKNDYKLIIVFSGINKILFNQTSERIKGKIDELRKVKFIESLNDNDLSLDIENNDTVVISILKDVTVLKKTFNLITNLDWRSKKVIIIDDECDYASINISEESRSKTYEIISNLYNRFHFVKLISFTGTPFAKLMSLNSELLRPNRIVNLINYSDYWGLHEFNKSENNQIIVDCLKENFKKQIISTTFFEWTILTALALIENNKFKSELILNIEINNYSQSLIMNFAKKSLNFWIKKTEDVFWVKEKIKNYWLKKLKIENHDVNYDLLIKKIRFVLEKLKNEKDSSFVLLNSKSDSSNFRSGNNQFCVIVGGYMISRGFTFENLTLELILNAPENKIAIDTLLQRCRWFGNRKNRLKYLRIIMNQKIADALKKAEQYVDIFEPGISTTNIDQIREKIRKLDLVNNEVESTNATKRK